MGQQGWKRRLRIALLGGACALLLSGCGGMSVMHRNQIAAVATATTLSLSPNADLEQTYYLGSFDPQGQVPPAVYRIRVRGQSAVLSRMRFASGWVPAAVVDGLTGTIQQSMGDGSVTTDKGLSEKLGTGRGMVMFGPEGFREAPRDHRLVIIMGSSPEKVEQAFSSALGTVARVRAGSSPAQLNLDVITLLGELGRQKSQLQSIVGQP